METESCKKNTNNNTGEHQNFLQVLGVSLKQDRTYTTHMGRPHSGKMESTRMQKYWGPKPKATEKASRDSYQIRKY